MSTALAVAASLLGHDHAEFACVALNFQAAFETPTRSENFGARRRGREGEEDDGERPPPEEMHSYRLIDLSRNLERDLFSVATMFFFFKV